MRHIPILFLAAAAFCAEDAPAGPPGGKPNAEAMKAAVEKAFTTGDANADGKLTRAEFAAAYEALQASRPAPPKAEGEDQAKQRPTPPKPTEADLDKAFATADANTDAALDKTEFQAALKALRPARGDKGKGQPPAPPAE